MYHAPNEYLNDAMVYLSGIQLFHHSHHEHFHLYEFCLYLNVFYLPCKLLFQNYNAYQKPFQKFQHKTMQCVGLFILILLFGCCCSTIQKALKSGHTIRYRR